MVALFLRTVQERARSLFDSRLIYSDFLPLLEKILYPEAWCWRFRLFFVHSVHFIAR